MGGTLNGRMLNAGRMINPDDLKQLAPTGKLRGGVVVSPAASVFFAIKDGKGEVRGVTLDLLRAFAETLKLPLVLQVNDNSARSLMPLPVPPATSPSCRRTPSAPR